MNKEMFVIEMRLTSETIETLKSILVNKDLIFN